MQRGSAVQHDRMFTDNIFQDVPDDRLLLLDHFLGLLDGCAVALRFELVIDERLEQFQRHLLRQTALVERELRTDDDHRTAGIINALAEQVLTEAPLLALERVAQRLQRTVVGSAQHAATAAVVKQRVNSFLQHTLFVAHDDVRRAELHKLLQAVVAVDDATIEIVQVRRSETSAIERHERAQLRRKNRDHAQNHPLRLVAALAECFQNFKPLGELDALLQRWIFLHLDAQFVRQFFNFHALQKFFDGFRAHASGELPWILLLQLAVFLFLKNFPLFQDGDFADVNDHKRFEVQNAFEVAHRDVQQIADAAGQTLKKPYVRTGRCQLDVAEAFTANFGQGNFD